MEWDWSPGGLARVQAGVLAFLVKISYWLNIQLHLRADSLDLSTCCTTRTLPKESHDLEVGLSWEARTRPDESWATHLWLAIELKALKQT